MTEIIDFVQALWKSRNKDWHKWEKENVKNLIEKRKKNIQKSL